MNVCWETLCNWWQDYAGNDFVSGYWLATALMLALLFIWLMVHFFCWLVFRRRRASSVVIAAANGDTEISDQAIFQSIHALEASFPRFIVEKIKLYRHGKSYSLVLNIQYRTEANSLSDEISAFKEKISAQLATLFGIRSIRKINFHLSGLKTPENQTAHDLDHVGV